VLTVPEAPCPGQGGGREQEWSVIPW